MKEKYTLIGYPLGHSMSPMIHERLFAIPGRDAGYDLTEIAPEELEERVSELRQLRGFNVTIPHKQSIIPFLDELGESARRYNSVNCVVNDGGKLIGYNTDCDGFVRSVEDYPMDGKVLLVGCGGVGRMMAVEAALHGADLTIGIIPCDQERAAALTGEILAMKPDAKIRIALTSELDESFDVILNASPVGMYPKTDACPISDGLIEKCSYVFDVVYNPVETTLMRKARALGKKAVGGAAMLVLQAVKAHELWDNDLYTEEQVQEIVRQVEQAVAEQFPLTGGAEK
ncbi:MAG: shikimate dehydrogenase [Ruminococcus sp.]|nr:shikimate dehydrogenase [Ruminococcus sp.]